MKREVKPVPIPAQIINYLPAMVPVIEETPCGWRVNGYAPIEQKKAA